MSFLFNVFMFFCGVCVNAVLFLAVGSTLESGVFAGFASGVLVGFLFRTLATMFRQLKGSIRE